MVKVTAFLGHDNVVRLRLLRNGGAANLADVTRMDLVLAGSSNTYTISSDNSANSLIRWNQSGYETGEVRIMLGSANMTSGSYVSSLVIFDANYANGLVWIDEELLLNVKDSPIGA